jgi:hypothetical protein
VEKSPNVPYEDFNPSEKGRDPPSKEHKPAIEAHDPLSSGVIQWVSLVIQ